MSMLIRERLLLWWGSLHIGEVIRRRALRRELRRHLTPSISPPPPSLKLRRTGRSSSNLEGEKRVRVLDAGCGRGDIALWIAGRHSDIRVDAVDIDPMLVELVRRRSEHDRLRNLHVQQADIEHSSFIIHHSSFPCAIIYSVDVFEHLKDPKQALANLVAVLVAGGALLIHVPRATQRRFFRRFEHYEQHDHERDGFEPEELTELMGRAGLHVADVRHTFGPPGALAWELFHLANGVGKWLALLTYPVTWTLAFVDGWFRWKRGNGTLVIVRKSEARNPKP